MQKRFSIRILALALGAVMFLAACGGGAPAGGGGGGAAAGTGDATEPASGGGQPVTLRVANIYAEDAYQSRSMVLFQQLVQERSENITVDLFFNAILGNETELSESVSAGTVDMVAVGAAMEIFLPNIMASEMPFLFEGWEHAYAVLNDERYIEILTRGAAEAGIIPLGFNAIGFRQISTNIPLHSMADFQGLRLRVPNIPHYLAMGEALGANYIAIPIVELFTALEQGVADAQENAYNVIIANRLYEVQNYIVESNHMLTVHMWFINESFFNALTPEDQQIVIDSFNEANQYNWDITRAGLEEEVAYIESQGLTILHPDEAFRNDMRAAMVEVWDWFADINEDGREILDLVEQIRLGN